MQLINLYKYKCEVDLCTYTCNKFLSEMTHFLCPFRKVNYKTKNDYHAHKNKTAIQL